MAAEWSLPSSIPSIVIHTQRRKSDPKIMSQSVEWVSLNGVFRRRRHPELFPAMPRDRIFATSTEHINKVTKTQTNDFGLVRNTPKRAVSMTRLDQLAQPNRRYLEDTHKTKNNLNGLSPTRPISSMSTSTDGSEVKRRVKPSVPRKPRPLSIGSPYAVKQKVEDKVVTTPRDSRTHDRRNFSQNRTRSAGGTPQLLVSPDSDPNNSLSKPTPPRKPAHVKAAAMARKAIKKSSSVTTLSEKTISSTNINKIEENENIINHNNDNSEEIYVPSVEPNINGNHSEDPNICDVMPSNVNNSNKKDISEEDYKKMMAEKRKMAREREREQTEQKEAEAEAQRLLIEQQKQEEEQRIKEEEEENKRRAEEEKEIERKEKEKRAKEEAEKQRLELEERLKRDEEERIARKKKLEAIMSRTRKTPPNQESSTISELCL